MRIQDEFHFILKPANLKKIGLILIRKIQDRTGEGIDQDNKPFKPYSTNTFALPAGALTKRAQKILVKDGHLQYFHSKNDNLWAVIIGGYAVMKKAVYAKTSYSGTVNLMATGKMMRSLRVQKAEGNEITIGFDSAEEANKAYYNKLMGREFLGVTADELNDPEINALIAGGVIVVSK